MGLRNNIKITAWKRTLLMCTMALLCVFFLPSTAQADGGYQMYEEPEQFYDQVGTPYPLPGGNLYIHNKMVIGCDEGVTEFTFPSEASGIRCIAYYGCSTLHSIHIPSWCTVIREAAFSGCTGLEEITVDPENNAFVTLDGVLFSGDETVLLAYPAKKEGASYVVPDSVVRIASGAFSGCSNLTSVTIPDSVTEIGDSVFAGCSNLTSVSIPDSVTRIGECAFRSCTDLTNISIPNSVTKIEAGAFECCTGLINVVIPDSVTAIEEYAFSDCSSLTSVKIPGSVTSIGRDAFQDCATLTDIYYAASEEEWNAIEIEEGAFSDSVVIHFNNGTGTEPAKTKEYNGHTYELYDVSLPWEEAQRFCTERGGYLAVITTQGEQSFINTLLPGGKNLYWIGLKDSESRTWVDGEALSYTNWAAGEPTGGNEKWVQLYGENHDACLLGQWNDILNEGDPAAAYYTLENTGFICEYGTPNEPTQADVHFPRVNVYHQDQFTDVKADQWFTSTVASAFEMGLMKGNSETTFNPYGDVTIAEAITMTARVHSIATTGSENFVQTEKWYQVYLDYAFQNGIIDYAYYNSDVTQKATRAQFAEIFAKSLPSEMLPAINQIADNAVPDVPMSAAYSGYVYLLYRAGILTGSDALGTFNPHTFITRAEAATILSRMAESSNRVTFTLGG